MRQDRDGKPVLQIPILCFLDTNHCVSLNTKKKKKKPQKNQS